MELPIGDIYIIGGIVSLALFLVFLWFLIKSIGRFLIWGALGGPSFFHIVSSIIERIVTGKPLDEKFFLQLSFFLRPIDQMLLGDYEPWMKACFAAILAIWFVIILGVFARVIVTPQFAAGLAIPIFWIVTGTAEGVRTHLARLWPPLEPIVMPYFGLLAVFIGVALAVIPILIINIATGRGQNVFAPAEKLVEALT